LHADEFGHIFEILAKNILIASGEHGYRAHAEFEQPLLSGGIV
jgi:hypothetical protein